MTNLDLIPYNFRGNLSATKIILDTHKKAKREGLHVGHWSEQFAELIGVQPADDREYGEPIHNKN